MKNIAIAAGFVLVTGIGANAADLIIDQPLMAPVETAWVKSPFYVQLLGGATLGNKISYYDYGSFDKDDSMEAGYAIDGAIGVTVWDSLSVEADLFHSRRLFEGEDKYGVATTSFMGNLKYDFALNDTFGVYVGGGLGYIWAHEGGDYDSEWDYNGFGYQLMAGVTAKLSANISAVAEYRYQATFGQLDDPENHPYSIELGTSSVLAGLKISF